jgi:hypothetical protein
VVMAQPFHVSRIAREKIILITVGVALLALIAFFPKQNQLFSYLNDHTNGEKIVPVNEALQSEGAGLVKKVQDISASDDVRIALTKHDQLKLVEALQEAKMRTGVGSINAIDPQGVLIGSFPNIKEQGNNIVLSTDWAQPLLNGTQTTAIGTGTTSPLIMVAGQFIKDSGATIGGVFGSYILNDDYARSFRNTYFDTSVNVAFYTPGSGVVGTTYADPETVKILNSYVGTSANNVQIEPQVIAPDQAVKIEGHYAYLHITPLTASNPTGPGLIYVIPSNHQSDAVIFVAIFTLLFFIFETYIHHIVFGHAWGSKHFFSLVFFACFFFFVSFLLVIYRSDKTFVDLKPSPYLIYNSTMRFAPSFGMFDTRFDQRIAVQVNTGSEYINAAEAIIHYDPTKVAVTDISTANSFCDPSMFIERSIDEKKGIVDVSCIVPNPGFNGVNGTLAELFVQPLQNGSFALDFDQETKVLANDGLGTDVLRLAQDSLYQVVDQKRFDDGGLVVFSSTHRNGERWYRSRTVQINWFSTIGSTYRYALDQIPGKMPANAATTTGSTARATASGDGLYYFHVQDITKGVNGDVVDYPVQIDTQAPDAPAILASATTVKQGDVVRLNFASNDALSGLQDTFYVKIGNDLLLPTKPPLYIPLTQRGLVPITVRAFDQAGNFTESSITISVE